MFYVGISVYIWTFQVAPDMKLNPRLKMHCDHTPQADSHLINIDRVKFVLQLHSYSFSLGAIKSACYKLLGNWRICPTPHPQLLFGVFSLALTRSIIYVICVYTGTFPKN